MSTIVVPAITLDDYAADHASPRLDVIKMDIEGNDCQALLGAAKRLLSFDPSLSLNINIPRRLKLLRLRLHF